MYTTRRSDAFLKTQETLKEIKIKLAELSKADLTNIHVGQEWSWIPYIKDHLDFLLEQVGGVESALQDGPPPVAPEDLERIAKEQSQL